MAKKKSNHQQKAAEQNDLQHHQTHKDCPHPDSEPQTTPAMSPEEDLSAKFEQLKELNKKLLEKTSQNREEINTLRESNKSLESKLTLSTSDIESLRKEMEDVSERNESLGKEKSEAERRASELESQLEVSAGEMRELEKVKTAEIRSLEKSISELDEEIRMVRSERDRVAAEKDAVGRDLESRVEAERNLERKLREVEAEAREKGEELTALKLKWSEVEKENLEGKRVIEVMKNEIELKDRCLAESNDKAVEARREAEQLKKEKMGLESHKVELSEKIGNLELETGKLRQVVSALETGKEEMGVKLMDIEKLNAEMLVKENKLSKEIGIWREGYEEKETEIENLKREKTDVERRMEELVKELEEVVRAKQLIQHQKAEVEETKTQVERDIADLKVNLSSVNAALSNLQEKHRETVEQNKKEVLRCKELMKKTEQEKEKVERALREERADKTKLEEMVIKLQKEVEDGVQDLKNSNEANDSLSKEKKVTESKYKKMVESNALLEREVASVQKQVADLKLGMELKSDLMERALCLMRSTAKQLTKATDFDSQVKGVDCADLEPFLAELEVIKEACASRGSKVEEMKQRMESMQECVMEARKNKSFWSLVSSATSVFAAAVLFAYMRK